MYIYIQDVQLSDIYLGILHLKNKDKVTFYLI